ncbi:glutathione S-transferase T3-like protein [Tanacetum coccineum]
MDVIIASVVVSTSVDPLIVDVITYLSDDSRKQVLQLLSDDSGKVGDFVNASIHSITSDTSLATLIASSSISSTSLFTRPYTLLQNILRVTAAQVKMVENGAKSGEDENVEDVQMADHLRPMEELLRIPILGIEDAIVVPAVLADQFELKLELLDFEEIDAFLSLDDSIPLGIDNGIYDSEGDIFFQEELLNDEISRDLPLKELKVYEPSMTKSLIEKPLDIDKEIYDSEGDILFLEKLLKDEPSKSDKSDIYTLIGEPPDTFLMEDEEIKLNPLKDSDDSVPIPRNDKEFVEPWTIEEEIDLCKAFVAKSEDSVQGNGKKVAGFWREVAKLFHEDMGEDKRSYDSVNYKWKNRIRPKLEYHTIYNAPFTLTECWKILKDHPKWKKFEMPKFYKSKQSSSKKSRTSENRSQGNSDSAHIGVNLNDEAADLEDVEAQEVPAPIGRDRAKKKGSSSGARSETSIAGDPSLVDALLSKFTMAATPIFTQRKESSSEYLGIKERELELEERKRQEQGELERLMIAQCDKELDLQQKMFEFQQQQKFEEDLKYYNEDHDHLIGRALSTALFLNKKIKERWNLDY